MTFPEIDKRIQGMPVTGGSRSFTEETTIHTDDVHRPTLIEQLILTLTIIMIVIS